MRHGKRNQRLSLPTDHRAALLDNLVRSLIIHGQIRTTYARAKEAQRLADRLVTLGKNGSLHSRRQAFRTLQDRVLVKRLFGEIAPRFVDMSGGYTRVTRLSLRRGDGAQQALLALSRVPVAVAGAPTSAKTAQTPHTPSAPQRPPSAQETQEGEKPKGFFDGLRTLWKKKKKGSAA
ncbi:MAG: 50S ribosomal protein L17 [Candidatus Omnitrophica bacterium]|nr:50S ribosomal protein L17 [Candidatus Omnitrophota bacterium]